MTPQEIAELRVLLARAKAAGSERLVDKVGPEKDHIWKAEGGYVSLLAGQLHIVPPGNHSDEWLVPALSVAQVTAVLELAGALPAVDREAEIRAKAFEDVAAMFRGAGALWRRTKRTDARCEYDYAAEWVDNFAKSGGGA